MNREYLKSRCFDDEDESWWQRRSGMERCLFVSFIVAILFSLACVIYIALQLLLTVEVCSNTVCLSESYKLLGHLNNSVDPCEDFFQYVCGGNEEDSDLSEVLKRRMDGMLAEDISEFNATNNERKLFQNCLNRTGSENFLSTFEEVLEEIGGWPVLVGYRWRARLFEWTDAVYSLKSRGYPFSMFLSAKLDSEGKIELSIVNITIPHKDLYLQFMIDTAVIFGADRYQAKLQMENVISFMEELKEVTNKNITFKKPDDLFGTNVTVDEIQKIYDEIQWLEFLNNLLYPYTVTNSDIVMIPNHELFGEFFDLITAVSRRVQANYVVWKVIEEMIPFMSKEVRYLKGNYTCQVEGGSGQDDWEFCRQFMDTVYTLRPLQLLYIQKYLPLERRIEIEELLQTVKAEAISTFDGENGEVLEAIDVIIGAPDGYFNESIFEELYARELEGDNIFDMVLSAKTNFYESFWSVDNNSLLLDLIKGFEINYVKIPDEAENDGFRYVMVIPSVVIDEYFDEERPMYLNYGQLGVAIADGLLKVLEGAWSNSTLESCKDGVQIAYQAYQSWSKTRGTEPKLVGTNRSPNQLFWITAVSSSCTKRLHLRPNKLMRTDFMCASSEAYECDVL